MVWKSLASDRGGNVAILFSLAMPMVLAAGACGVETTSWFMKRSSMQSAADAAAYAGALANRSGAGLEEIVAAARLVAAENGFDLDHGSITVTPKDLNGGGEVQVLLQDTSPLIFTQFFLKEDVRFSTQATATYNSASNACILSLDPSASAAANFSGNSTVTLNGCSVMANSTASNAVNVQGSTLVTTDCAIAVGGVAATSGLHMTQCDTPITQAPPVADPFRKVPAPTETGGYQQDNKSTLSPGVYKNGLDLKGATTLEPGVYYVKGDFSLNANAVVTGTGVTIYLTDGGHVKMNGGAHVELSAPTTGPYAGILFFGDRKTAGGTNKFLGDATSLMTGAIYFPTQQVEWQGNFSGKNGCTRVVGKTVEWTGNTTLEADCKAEGLTDIPIYSLVKLTA